MACINYFLRRKAYTVLDVTRIDTNDSIKPNVVAR